ncbi:ATP-binding protein [Paracoccus saliphilus]|uniref:ATP-binding protein n=1 Tax=Paracoccus saliphilus TaxID=405559 RepID=UPI00158CBDB1
MILDDFALLPMGRQEAVNLFEVIEDRDETASTMLISQRPVADWCEVVGEDLLADAFLDRVRNQTHRDRTVRVLEFLHPRTSKGMHDTSLRELDWY